jgi:hypothetical protein
MEPNPSNDRAKHPLFWIEFIIIQFNVYLATFMIRSKIEISNVLKMIINLLSNLIVVSPLVSFLVIHTF